MASIKGEGYDHEESTRVGARARRASSSVAVRRRSAPTAAPAQDAGTSLIGAGRDVPVPAHLEVDPGSRSGLRDQHHVLADRLGRRHRRRSPPARSTSAPPTRRSRPTSSTACKGCVVIPWALVGDVDPVQPARASNGRRAPRRADAREHLPRRDHELERPGDQGAQPGAARCRTRRSRRSTAPTARARPTTSPSTSRRSAPTWKSKVGVNTSVSWPTGVGARGSSGVAGVVTKTEGALTYVDVAYSLDEQVPVRARSRTAPASSRRPASAASRRRSRRCRRRSRS